MSAMTAKDRTRAAQGGAIAGVIAGAVLALFLVLYNVALGQSGWVALKGASFPFLRERAMLPGFDLGAVLLGVVCHFMVSAVWGTIFGLVCYGLSNAATGLAGVLYGLVVWIVMFYIVLPIVGAGQISREAPLGLAVFEHLLFGIVTAVAFLPFQVPVHRVKIHHVPG